MSPPDGAHPEQRSDFVIRRIGHAIVAPNDGLVASRNAAHRINKFMLLWR